MAKSSRHRNGAGNRVTVYERVTARVTELLQQGVVPWQKPWHAKVGSPRNGVSGRFYRGLNVFLLSHAGYESPWWFTPKQVNDLNGHIIKGEKVSWVHFFKPWFPKGEPADPLEVETDEVEISTHRRPILIIRAYRVVNVDQCAGPGIDKFRAKHPPVEGPANDNDPIAACEEIVSSMPQRPGIRYGGDKAFYRQWTDVVHVPRRNTFTSSEAFYSVVFHELTHATGHEGRLNRKTLTDGTPFGSPTYSREELVAEMGAAFLCAMAGIDDPTIQNSAAYIHGWLKFLKTDPKALVIAGAQAQKASDFIMGWAGVEQVEADAEASTGSAGGGSGLNGTRGNVPVHWVDEWTGGKRLAGPLCPTEERVMLGTVILSNGKDSDLLADSLGGAPEQLDSGKCGCDRPRWNIRPCGHCTCKSECDDCPANKLWRWEQESWCGCAQPGRDGVLACGHCACGYGCFEVVRGDSHAPMQKVPCVT